MLLGTAIGLGLEQKPLKIITMKTLLITAALAVFTLSGFAQNHGTPQPGQHDYVKGHSDKMTKDFGLNDDQNQRLNELNTTHYNEQMKMRQSSNDQAMWKQNEERANKDYDNKLRGIFDEKQYKQYESNRMDYRFQFKDNGQSTPNNTRDNSSQPQKK